MAQGRDIIEIELRNQMIPLIIFVAVHLGIVALIYSALERRSDGDILKRKFKQNPFLAGCAGAFGLYWTAILYSFYLRTYKPIAFFISGVLVALALSQAPLISTVLGGNNFPSTAIGISFFTMYLSAYSVRGYARRAIPRP